MTRSSYNLYCRCHCAVSSAATETSTVVLLTGSLVPGPCALRPYTYMHSPDRAAGIRGRYLHPCHVPARHVHRTLPPRPISTCADEGMYPARVTHVIPACRVAVRSRRVAGIDRLRVRSRRKGRILPERQTAHACDATATRWLSLASRAGQRPNQGMTDGQL